MPKSDEVSEFRKLVGIEPTLPGLTQEVMGVSAREAEALILDAVEEFIVKHGGVALKGASINREGKDLILNVGNSQWKIKVEKK